MITEDYVSYEVAKLLKEKGFAEPCQAYWRDFENGDRVHTTFAPNENHNNAKGFISMPTHQMVMKWLREMHNIFIIIEPHMYDYVNERNASYVCSIWVGDNYYENPTSTDYPTFEEAVDAILKYSLVKLI